MSQQFYKKMYSVKEYYNIIRYGLKTIKNFRDAKKSGMISADFESRIMLAVTEVNGCELCTYYHTSEALKNGMTDEDIATMLNGDANQVPADESVAIFFAQHYADLRGKPKRSAWNRLVETYGKEKAYAILGATRAIMFGNVNGIAVGAFKDRVKGKPVEKSSLGYELAIIFGTLVFIPAAFFHNLGESIHRNLPGKKAFSN